ncbi:hypothetical protein FNH05_23375 [Amycolatopsis rhizosphaerae]|uniref:Uncharacterized protein n=1 Tax=Amycolatopsis rhizosphaerae TaxID=2053003 RepID=A0A558BWC9_9PSEU|nr:hypothetical protein [Amycolatopsis rhizosphaerae]TVT40791.1 hypothetical protein FNH05_23375 [Amycolatopsis rhizosphaerae]
MTSRILGIELRRSAAPASGALIAALGVAGLWSLVLSGQASLWDTQWTTLAAFGRIMLVVLWPLAAGAGVWQVQRDLRCGTGELLGTTALPARRRMLPTAVALGLCLVLGYAATLAVGAIRVSGSTSRFHTGWLPVAAVGALSLVAAAWSGMGIGRLFPSAYTAPVLVVACFLLLLAPIQLAKSGAPGRAALLSPVLVEKVDEFSTVAGSVSLAQAVWFGGLAAGGLTLVLLARRRTAITAAAAPVLSGLLAAIPLLGAAPVSGLRQDPAAVAEVCTRDGGPVVCVTRAHEQGLSSLVGPARRALQLLAKLPDPPSSVHEVTGERTGPQPADEVWLHSDNYAPGQGWPGNGDDELVVRILAGAGTRPCDPVDYRTRAIAAAWLYGSYPAPGLRVTPGEETSARDAAWQALTALPVADQTRRIAAVRAAGLHCQDDPAAALTGGGR